MSGLMWMDIALAVTRIKMEVEMKSIKEIEMNDGTWLDKCHRGTGIVFNLIYCLDELANSFYRTGNNTIGDELRHYSDQLNKAHKFIQDGIGESISEGVKRSGEMSATILKAALAGCLLGEQDQNRLDQNGGLK